MKFSKAFSKVAGARGRIVYRRSQKVAVPVKLNRVTASLAPNTAPGTVNYSLTLDGEPIAQGSGSGDKPFVADLGIRIKRGERVFEFTAEGFGPQQQVDGTVEIEFGFF